MEWMKVGTLDKILIYPLKSGKGLEVKEAKVESYGLANHFHFDRRFLLCDSLRENKVLDGRRYPGLVLVELSLIDSQHLKLTAPGMESLTVALPQEHTSPKVSLDISSGDLCEGSDCGPETSLWFGRYLEPETAPPCKFRLIYHSQDLTSRSLNKKQPLTPLSSENDVPYYAYGYPILLTASKSLDELNAELGRKGVDLSVEARQFRPNIHVLNSIPFDEDNWARIRIGESAVFRNDGPCARCTFTTVDPTTAERNNKSQPLKTLKDFRILSDICKRSPCFGIYAGIETPGFTICKGDPIFVTYLK